MAAQLGQAGVNVYITKVQTMMPLVSSLLNAELSALQIKLHLLTVISLIVLLP